MMSMGEGAIATLRSQNPSFDAMFAPTGMLSALTNPEVRPTLTTDDH